MSEDTRAQPRGPGARLRVAAATVGLICMPGTLAAQRPDSVAAQRPDTVAAQPQAVDTVGPKPELKPPLSPRRAFLYSLVLPGYAQSVLGRGKTGTLLVAFESVALVMLRESAANLREARRFLADSIPVSYVDENGTPRVVYEPTRFTASLVRTRREQVEDWIAVLIANHLFAAADAYVAALLWDLPAEVAVRPSPRSVTLGFRVAW